MRANRDTRYAIRDPRSANATAADREAPNPAPALTLALAPDNMCDNNNPTTQSIADYLAQLLKDRKQLAAFPNVFMHMERLLDEGMSPIAPSPHRPNRPVENFSEFLRVYVCVSRVYARPDWLRPRPS